MKPHQPKIKYLLPSPHGYVPVDEHTWQAPMRLTRSGADPAHGFTYGRYFKGITDLISREGFRLLVDATRRQLGEDISTADVEGILICAEKHGSDYHPARIEVMVDDRSVPLVMNVALDERGKAWLYREFDVLQYLNRKYDFPFLPRPYFHGEAFPPPMLMFLGDWFQGYHEFHLSIDKEDDCQTLVLWDTEKGARYLSRPQMWQTYSQAAKILTLYYDIETFEQVFPWHHAAGDFVVKAQGSSIDVRLVTARQYTPMLERSAGVSVHDGLLFFFLNLSVRMRLDRLDGVGDVAWADDESVDATLEGFLAGLRIKEQKGAVETGFVAEFVQHIRSLAKEDLSDRFFALVDASDQAAPDMPVIRLHLNRHISKVYRAFQGLKRR
jgi:hypothetical protein